MKIKVNLEFNFDNLGNVFADYESVAKRFWAIRKECGYRKSDVVWISSAPKKLRDAYADMEKYEEGVNTLWFTSRKLYAAVAKTRRAAEKYMAMTHYEKCLHSADLQRMMTAFMKEDEA